MYACSARMCWRSLSRCTARASRSVLMAESAKAQLTADLRLLARLERGEPISPDELRCTRVVAEETLAILTKHKHEDAYAG